jgi:hypothetical protein
MHDIPLPLLWSAQPSTLKAALNTAAIISPHTAATVARSALHGGYILAAFALTVAGAPSCGGHTRHQLGSDCRSGGYGSGQHAPHGRTTVVTLT